MTDYLLSPAVARRLGVKTSTLAQWRHLGKGPRGWVRYAPTCVAYPVDEIERWLAERREDAA